jgi:CoA:oxalate CoA-transferase
VSAQQAKAPQPLAGIVVLDLSQIYNGPYATFLLAMAGAEVIKVEPRVGEHLRRRGALSAAALPFAMLNRNKHSVSLDLKTTKGRDLLLKLAARADVLVENFAPGAMDRLGLGVEAVRAINPRLIYASSSGYGSTGPYRDYPAMDLTVQAMSGVMSITGFPDRPPVKSGPALCDFFAGVHLYGAIVTALFERERTGKGRSVEVAMLDSVYMSLASNLSLSYSRGWKDTPRTGNRHGGLAEAPYNVYPTKSGHIAIICVGEGHWATLAKVMQREDLLVDPRFQTMKARATNIDLVDQIVSEFSGRFETQELFALLLKHRIPSAPVRTLEEVVSDPHLHERGMLEWAEHPTLGRIVVPGSPMRYEGAAPMAHVPSAELGSDNEKLLSDLLGLSKSEIEKLKNECVI